MTSSMPAIVRRARGTSLELVPVPRAQASERTISVRLAGVCRTDLFVAEGRLPVEPPRVLGHELVGTLDGSGARVTVVPALPCGACEECSARPERCARPTFLGVGADGAFAGSVRVPAACVRPIPDALSDREGAFVEPFAAALAVLEAPIPRSAQVAVTGRNRIATLVRRVVAHATGREPTVLDDVDDEDAREAFDVVIETVPTAAAIARALGSLRPRGLLVLKSRPIEHVPLDLGRMVQRELRAVGVRYGSFDDAIRWMTERRIEVSDLFGPTFALARFEEAFALARREGSPKVFLTIESAA